MYSDTLDKDFSCTGMLMALFSVNEFDIPVRLMDAKRLTDFQMLLIIESPPPGSFTRYLFIYFYLFIFFFFLDVTTITL